MADPVASKMAKTDEADAGVDGSIAEFIETVDMMDSALDSTPAAAKEPRDRQDGKAVWESEGTPTYSPETAAAVSANSPRSTGGATALQIMQATTDYKAAVARAEIKVREVMEKRAAKQKPNETCLCGSGKKYKKCCGVPLDPKKLNPHGMTVQGEARWADGTIRKDAITVRMEATGELVQMPLNQLARNESHAQAVKDNDAARARGEVQPQARLPAVRGRVPGENNERLQSFLAGPAGQRKERRENGEGNLPV